ncbi:MAG: hypothetical protein J6M12_04905 [Clostridia bacterium]|nr:hypothetical protein [Clostridia bacterium]
MGIYLAVLVALLWAIYCSIFTVILAVFLQRERRMLYRLLSLPAEERRGERRAEGLHDRLKALRESWRRPFSGSGKEVKK